MRTALNAVTVADDILSLAASATVLFIQARLVSKKELIFCCSYDAADSRAFAS
jgi:hypothetical protein